MAVAVAFAAAASLVLAPTTGATIRPQRGIAGISLGMTRAQVERAAGRPVRVLQRLNEFGSVTELVYPRAILVDFQGDARVTAVSTTGKLERTSESVGVGSTRAQILRLVRGTRCETTAGFTHCFLGSFRPGARVTDFSLSHGRVIRVTVGFVID